MIPSKYYPWIGIWKSIKKEPNYKSHFALFIKQVQDTKSSFDQVNAGLVVVVLYHSPGDLFLHVLFLLQLKHMLMREKREFLYLVKKM